MSTPPLKTTNPPKRVCYCAMQFSGLSRMPYCPELATDRDEKSRFIWSGCFQIAGRKLAALGDYVEADALTFREGAHASLLHGGHVHEHVLFSVFRLDESKSLGAIEKLNSADCHSELIISAARNSGAVSNNLAEVVCLHGAPGNRT